MSVDWLSSNVDLANDTGDIGGKLRQTDQRSNHLWRTDICRCTNHKGQEHRGMISKIIGGGIIATSPPTHRALLWKCRFYLASRRLGSHPRSNEPGWRWWHMWSLWSQKPRLLLIPLHGTSQNTTSVINNPTTSIVHLLHFWEDQDVSNLSNW